MTAKKDNIKAFNAEYNRINAELNKHGMRLVSSYIFKGKIPYSQYMGHMNDYEKIIQQELTTLKINRL